MKYRPTLLNIGATILIVYANSYWFLGSKTDTEGWGGVAVITLTFAGTIGLLIDFGLQIFVKKYFTVNGIELIVIVGLLIYSKWTEREKTVVFPDNFKGYLTIVYDVEEGRPLYKSSLNFGYKVEIPEDGILFTSTPKRKDIWNTRFQTKSGQLLENSWDSTKLHATDYEDGDYVCNDENWEFRTWLISNRSGWNKNVDIDTVTAKAIMSYCEGKR